MALFAGGFHRGPVSDLKSISFCLITIDLISHGVASGLTSKYSRTSVVSQRNNFGRIREDTDTLCARYEWGAGYQTDLRSLTLDTPFTY